MNTGCQNQHSCSGSLEAQLAHYGITLDPPLAIHEEVIYCLYAVEKFWCQYAQAYPLLSSWLQAMEAHPELALSMNELIPLGYRLQLLLKHWNTLGRPDVSWPTMGSCSKAFELGKSGQWSWLDVIFGKEVVK